MFGSGIYFAEKPEHANSKAWHGSQNEGLIEAEVATAEQDTIRFQTGYDGVGDSGLVIEAVFEDLNLKHSIIKQLEEHIQAVAGKMQADAQAEQDVSVVVSLRQQLADAKEQLAQNAAEEAKKEFEKRRIQN